MNRKEFIQTCTFSCLGVLGVSSLLQSCIGPKYMDVKTENSRIRIRKDEFAVPRTKKNYRNIILRSADLKYPIVLYRLAENDYMALLLQCTHQLNELNVHGDIISCPAHGSEFGRRGEVIQGPAEQALKNYKVETDQTHIYITLA